MTLLIALDQSTSATKALLVDAQARVLDSESLGHEQHYPQPGWVEHDAEEIWSNTLTVTRTLCERNADVLKEVAGVTISNQRETFVSFDRASGKPVGHALVWQDRRADPICAELRDSGADEQVIAKTGLRIDSYFSAPKMAWLIRQGGEIAKGLQAGTTVLSTIDAYLVHRLTSGEVFATDPTNASRTLLMDIQRLAWDSELCDLFGVPESALPEIRDSSAQFGETDLGGALPHQVPICGVLGDSQASLFAQRCYSPGDAKATFGTGTSVLVNVGSEFRAAPEGAVAALAWVINGTPTYAWEGLINYSAATLAWLKDQLGLIESIDQVEPMAASVEDSGGVYLVPAFSGMGAPHWKPDARAAIVGMSGYTRREHVVRAALESIALQVGDVLSSLAKAGVSPTLLNGDGGPTRNQLLMQMVSDVSDCQLHATQETNLSAIGAAMAGLLGLGIVDSLEGLRSLPRESRAYSPTTNRKPVDALVVGWGEAVSRVL